MVQKFVANLVLVILANLLVKPYWIFGVDRVVQNTVGTDAYGLYYALFNLSLLPTMLLDAGLNQYNNNTLAKHPDKASAMFAHLLPVKLLLMALYLLVVSILGFSKGFQFNSTDWNLLFVLGLNQALAYFILYIRTHFTGLHLFKTDTLFSILDKSLMIIFCSVLLYTQTLGVLSIEKFAWAQFTAYAFTVLLGMAILLPHLRPLKWSVDLKMNKDIFKKSYPYALLAVMMAIYNRVDVVILESIHPQGDTQAGIYAKCYRMLDAFNMLAVLAAGLLMPMFARMYKQKENIQPLAQTAFILLVIPATLVALFCIYNNSEILDLLYHGNYNQTEIDVSIPTALCMIPMAANYIFGSLLTAVEQIKVLNIISLISIIINISCNYILIPKYGAIGTAYAAIITQCFAVSGSVYYCKTKLNVLISSTVFLKYILLTIIVSGVLWAIHFNGLNLIVSLGLTAILSLVLMFLFKWIQPKEWASIFKNLKN